MEFDRSNENLNLESKKIPALVYATYGLDLD